VLRYFLRGELGCICTYSFVYADIDGGGFVQDNPKVRTLCNCGMNRTNFHMSCLLEWLNRDRNCPVCREYLFYEDS
jgi:hypothetical protein